MWVNQEIHIRLFLHRYSGSSRHIKHDIPNKVMSVFEVWNISTMFPKCIRTRNTTRWCTSSIGNKGIIWRYLMIIHYSTYDICWAKPSIRITRRKSWACADCKQPNIAFFLMVMSSFKFIYKKATQQNILCFKRYNVPDSKTSKVKI